MGIRSSNDRLGSTKSLAETLPKRSIGARIILWKAIYVQRLTAAASPRTAVRASILAFALSLHPEAASSRTVGRPNRLDRGHHQAIQSSPAGTRVGRWARKFTLSTALARNSKPQSHLARSQRLRLHNHVFASPSASPLGA